MLFNVAELIYWAGCIGCFVGIWACHSYGLVMLGHLLLLIVGLLSCCNRLVELDILEGVK
ncbi:hypothetical protein HanXRQr2_Chr14g0631571 [Helianthus annuus]|uniref:Uncharacterized protein n=1 Tax=Helianthus annuus TaxID=4232 RepID=A0A9K3H6C1_HELAN|nr:hypothetical protein HanXRQr2_Chr14g0631571 [Helianthus annuus]KAJ0839355.1 hypothetical protein HanPSC8_Chr14g0605861 [Helianthus annuus]